MKINVSPPNLISFFCDTDETITKGTCDCNCYEMIKIQIRVGKKTLTKEK